MSCPMLPQEAREFFLTLLATAIREWIMWSDAPEKNKAVAYADVERALKFKGKNGLPPSPEFRVALRRILKIDGTSAKRSYERDIQAAGACGVIDGGPDAVEFNFDAGIFSARLSPNPWTATKYLAKMAALPVGTWRDVIQRLY